MLPNNFFRAEPGQKVTSAGKNYLITHLLSADSVLATDEETGAPTRLKIELIQEFQPPIEHVGTDVEPTKGDMEVRNLALYNDAQWAEAQRRLQAIKPLLENPIRTREEVEAQGAKVGANASTLYKWLKLFQDSGQVSSLVPYKRGRRTGVRLIDPVVEKIIESAIEDIYFKKQRHKAQDVVDEVFRLCRNAKVDPPHANTVRARVTMHHLQDPANVLRRRGHRDVARNRYAPIQGPFPGGTAPYSVVQVDHTEVDIILVDEVNRKPIGRPWLTLAIDTYSRMIAGIYISFERPNSAAVGMCLAQAICTKRDYLAKLEVGGEWPMWGVMRTVYTDNAKEFRGGVLRRACDEYDINLDFRPVTLPHYGGCIERMMGTVANEIRKLPGTTFSNPMQRRGYDSEGQSAISLKEFECHFVDFIVNVYHQRVHSELGMSPRRKWEIGISGNAEQPGVGLFAAPSDPLRVHLDFMPFFMRSVQQYGVQIDNITYYEPVLDPYINAVDPENPKAKREFLLRRDPRDISKVYFLDPGTNQYVALSYRNIGLPPMSAYELREISAKLKAEGRKDIDEHLIFQALERMRERIEEAKLKTKAARRQATRIPPQPKPQVSPAAPNVSPASSKVLMDVGTSEAYNDDPFASPIETFSEVSLTR